MEVLDVIRTGRDPAAAAGMVAVEVEEVDHPEGHPEDHPKDHPEDHQDHPQADQATDPRSSLVG